jgi:hypothetical protein
MCSATCRAAAVQQMQARSDSCWWGRQEDLQQESVAPLQDAAQQWRHDEPHHPEVMTRPEAKTSQQGSKQSNKPQPHPRVVLTGPHDATTTMMVPHHRHHHGGTLPPVSYSQKHSSEHSERSLQNHNRHNRPTLTPSSLSPTRQATHCEPLQQCGGRSAIQTACAAAGDGAVGASSSSQAASRSAASGGRHRDQQGSSAASSTAVVGQVLTKQTVMDRLVEVSWRR